MPAYDPETEVSHFKFWEAQTDEKLSIKVVLKGQFNENPTEQASQSLAWLANPVRKTYKGKAHPELNPSAHLLGYLLERQSEPTRWVQLTNQLTEAPVFWSLGPPTLLLVPASKVPAGSPPPPPDTVDHFECYLASGPTVQGPMVLQDQIDQMLNTEESVTVFRPVMFCVPVTKNQEPVHHPRAHLALYEMARFTPKSPISVQVRDQFAVRALKLISSLMLGVPTEKLAWGKGERTG